MQKYKIFIQYSEYSFSINVTISTNGNVRAKNQMIYKGNNYKKRQQKIGIKWNKENKEYKRIKLNKWRNESPKKLKAQLSRRRNFGFNPLNDPFSGCEGHHINKIDVIFIPKELHCSIRHSVTKSRNMDKINKAAFEWMENNEIS